MDRLIEKFLNSFFYWTSKRKYIKKRGRGAFVHYTVRFRKKKSVTLGTGAEIKHHSMFKGKITIGNNTNIYPYANLKTRNSEIIIGNNSHVH